MNRSLINFEFDHLPVRMVMQDGEPWFVARDVCEVFGDAHYRRSVARLDDDEKGVTPLATPGGMQPVATVNEAGLYSLLFNMQPQNKASMTDGVFEERVLALKRFKRWVTHEVLPKIRQTGGYALPANFSEALRELADQWDKNQALQAEIQVLTPKADFHDAVADARGAQSIRDVAKVLGTGQNRLFAWLREQGILMPDNTPYQRFVDEGYLRVIEQRPWEDASGEMHPATKTLVTGKGLAWLQKRFHAGKARQAMLDFPPAN